MRIVQIIGIVGLVGVGIIGVIFALWGMGRSLSCGEVLPPLAFLGFSALVFGFLTGFAAIGTVVKKGMEDQ